MNGLILWAGQNTFAALILALLVYSVTRVWRHPPTAHLLWLLVLLKLVAPPIFAVNLPRAAPQEAAQVAQAFAEAPDAIASSTEPIADDIATSELVAAAPQLPLPAIPLAVAEPLAVETEGAPWSLIVQRTIVALWLAGAGICGLVTITRIVRFEQLLRDTLPASRRCEHLTAEIAARLGIRRAPTVRYVQSADVPMLWCAGLRPTIVLPIELVNEISEDRLALILAHELAHLRRRDHWVRVFELCVVTLYWWNPLAWFIRRQIHQAEDLCCDAWVRWAFPNQTHHYAEAVFAAADRLSESRPRRPLMLASPFFHTGSLKARIEMILHGQFAPQLSQTSKWLVALLALIVIPSAALSAKDEASKSATTESATTPATDSEETPAATKAAESNSAALEFPHVVQFEQGATRFADGDDIKISEIRGTSATFSPGNIYRIKGTYTLTSHDRATLAAYTTAREAKDGTSTSYKVQSTKVDKGTGTFTLYLPMSCQGWPHVSFYPADGGNGFGGNYFGTGESTLKHWWNYDGRTAGRGANEKADNSGRTLAPAAGAATPAGANRITLTSPQLKSVTLTRQFVAQIHSQRHIKLRSLERGYLESVAIKEGQQVKVGDTLFKINPILYKKKVEAEEAEKKLMEIKLKGAKKLQADKVITADEVAIYEAEFEKAKANADRARAELDFASIKAPFDGMIGRLQVGQGSLVEEGEILTTLSDNTTMWVYFNVPEARYLEYMQNKQQEDLKIELMLASGKKFDQPGKIGAIEADFNNETGNIAFRADFPNPDRILRHGQAGSVLISHVLNDALVIPQRSTFEVLGKRYVYVVDAQDVAQQREIDVVNELEDIFVIKKGTIGPDDRIVRDGVRRVQAGEKVEFEAN